MKRRAAHKGWEGFSGERISFLANFLILWELNTIQGASLLWYWCTVMHIIVWIHDCHKCGRKVSINFEKLGLLKQSSACFTPCYQHGFTSAWPHRMQLLLPWPVSSPTINSGHFTGVQFLHSEKISKCQKIKHIEELSQWHMFVQNYHPLAVWLLQAN